MRCSGCQKEKPDDGFRCCETCRTRARERSAFYRAYPGVSYPRSPRRDRLSDEERRLRRRASRRRWVGQHAGRTLAQSTEQRRLHRLRRRGLTLEGYADLLQAQDGRCAICREPSRGRRLAVDHDHITGRVRGLLCTRCNMGLGFFQDSAVRLQAAQRYIVDARG
jgi:hypothetical protein